ncbi:30S ribosomal protein S15, partial [Paenibacillus sp. 28ISP30-2]|nr:30S ribosomal protein S15 [Paenibacillus sp. 28ISP30-2]
MAIIMKEVNRMALTQERKQQLI